MKFSNIFGALALVTQVTAAAIGKSLMIERGSGALQDIVSD